MITIPNLPPAELAVLEIVAKAKAEASGYYGHAAWEGGGFSDETRRYWIRKAYDDLGGRAVAALAEKMGTPP